MEKKPNVRFCTMKEVEMFNTHPYNRKIDKKHLNNIKRGMVTDLANFPAIQVNTTTNNEIDGHHRRLAYLELIKEGKLPKDARLKVEFITVPESGEYGLLKSLNNGQDPWNLKNYCESYVEQGNENYIKLQELGRRHPISTMGVGIKWRYPKAATKGTTGSTDLKDGTFTVTDEEIKFGDKILKESSQLAGLVGLPLKGQAMERLIASWSKKRRNSDVYSIPFDKFVVATKGVKFNPATTNMEDFDNYYLALIGYMQSDKFKKEYEKTRKHKAKSEKAA